MKGTDHFKRTIKMYLEQRAEEDTLFAKKYRNPAKNMDDCVTHILNYVQKSGCNGFTDGEIFGQAIHYYEENEIEVGKPMNCQVVVNHVVELGKSSVSCPLKPSDSAPLKHSTMPP
ncbi:PcfK-like protein [Bacteroides sp. AR29]|nr:PcfK-like protein [Bacteroides sp. AR29]